MWTLKRKAAGPLPPCTVSPKILQRAASSGPGALRKDNEDGASCHLILTGPQETRAQLLTSARTPSQEDPYLES